MLWSRRLFLGGFVASAGCGFQPVYDAQTSRALTGQISVDDIDGMMGFELRRVLEDRLGATQTPRWRLKVTPDVLSEGLAISQDNATTRYNLTGSAAFTLTPKGQASPVLSEKVVAFTAYSALAAPYATRVAERDAQSRLARALADKIVTRLAVTAQNWSP